MTSGISQQARKTPTVAGDAAAAGGRPRPAHRNGVNSTTVGWLLRLATAAALAVDAFVHASLASTYDPIRATVSQGQLFRVEAAAALAAAVLILAWANRLTWLFAVLVLAGGLAAVLFYQFVDPGRLGPLPDMYDPQWTPAKAASVVAEGLGALLAAIGLARAVRAERAASHLRTPA